MARNKVELIIKNQQGVSNTVDVLDFPYRLNRTVFTTSQDRLKTLGGTNSTRIRLAKSKRNNQIFLGRARFNSNNKFNNLTDYEAIITENGAQIGVGTFKLEQITSTYYQGTFFDQDINWVDSLSSINLNTLGYVDGKPTWTVPFDGAISFNQVNDLSNNQTDFVCPTVVYNNTPVADYLDLTDSDIWGIYQDNRNAPPSRVTDGGSYPNDFVTINGFFGDRLGLTFQDFPPALYYKNVLQRVFSEAGVSVECPLFDEAWFNSLIMPYVGAGYQYNWKNLATVSADLESTFQSFDRATQPDDNRPRIELYSDMQVTNTFDLNNQSGGTSGITLPTPQYDNFIGKYKLSDTIRYDDTSTLVDKITAVNKFGIPGQYICPVDGEYTISVRNSTTTNNEDFTIVTDNPPANYTVFDGSDLWSSYATQDTESSKAVGNVDRHYGWSDQVLVVLRKNDANELVYADTMNDLYKWMSGENKDFINNPSDVIAYVSPKRYEFFNSQAITNPREAYGSPITDNSTDKPVVINMIPTHSLLFDNNSRRSATSEADITITVDLVKNERIEIFWVSLSDIIADTTAKSYPGGFENEQHDSCNLQQVEFNRVFNSNPSDYSITYNCGEEELDLAVNLPAITAKDFVSSFIRQFNLNVSYSDGTVRFLPQTNYFSNDVYDISSRVVDNDWSAVPLPTPKEWIIGYSNDVTDRLLNTVNTACSEGENSNYANITLSNDNTYSDDVIIDSGIFSSTRFTDGQFRLIDRTVAGIQFPVTTPDPASGVQLTKGILFGNTPTGGAFFNTNYQVPSIQSLESFNQSVVGDLTYSWNYSPRLLYHLGTVGQYLNALPLPIPLDNYNVLVDSPRADDAFVRLDKHWFRPTVSQFDGENSILTNINHPTLRYDTMNGLYNRYFENLIDLYNESEQLTLNMAIRSIDWIRMTGSKRIRYNDQLYRLSQIKDYDPLNNNLCEVVLVREL